MSKPRFYRYNPNKDKNQSELKKELPELVDIAEAATFLRTTKSSIYNLVWRKRISSYKPGRKVLIKKIELVRYLESTRK